MIENQRRLLEFKKTMSPVVVLNRIENEDELEWPNCDPLLSTNVKTESLEAVKEEFVDYDDSEFQPWENLEQMFTGDISEVKSEPSYEAEHSTKRVRKQTVKQFVPFESKPRPKKSPKKQDGPKVPAGSRRCPFCPAIIKNSSYRGHVSSS